jgi:hypothetical protein
MKKNLIKLSILFLVATFSITACKKSTTSPSGGSYFMKFNLNTTAVSYNTCNLVDITANGIKQLNVLGSNTGGKDSFSIDIVADYTTLKVGQTFTGQSDYFTPKGVLIAYFAPNGSDYGTQIADSSAVVKITAVNSTAIAGTFSARLYDDADLNADTLKYTVSAGSFNAQLPK